MAVSGTTIKVASMAAGAAASLIVDKYVIKPLVTKALDRFAPLPEQKQAENNG